MSQPNCNEELPPHLAAKGVMPDPEVKPSVQEVNAGLTDATPTGYAIHCDKPSAETPPKAKK